MATGLIALLDDVAAIAKMAAASVDDVAAQAGKAGVKAAGVVIDDTAVTPRYVVGFSSERELPIVGKIMMGSLRNKLIFLLPGALLLSVVAPWAITPLLMLGGLFLCYEGAEKVLEAFFPHAAHEHEAKVTGSPTDPVVLERERVAGAIRTDFILSAEIMALTLASVPDTTFLIQAIVLAVVGVGVTVLVYGAVALIVKADDLGVAMARSELPGLGFMLRPTGILLVKGMPVLLRVLAVIGTAAMIWVGGGILIHGLAAYGMHAPEHHILEFARHVVALVPIPAADGALTWFVSAFAAGLLGLAVGGATIPVVGALQGVMARFRKPS